MKENALVILSRQFAVDTVKLCTEIKENRKGNILINQLLRSGTSIGANIHEGNYASSRADFINKFQIALKECYETEYWLNIFKETDFITEKEFNDMFLNCSKIRKLLTTSITTAKNNSTKKWFAFGMIWVCNSWIADKSPWFALERIEKDLKNPHIYIKNLDCEKIR